MAKMATETALVECVDGNPYSRAAEAEREIRCSGGEVGRGRQTRSFMKPLKKTPAARMWIMLDLQVSTCRSPTCTTSYLASLRLPRPVNEEREGDEGALCLTLARVGSGRTRRESEGWS